MAKGDVFQIASNADFVFQRLVVELSGYYLLSFEPLSGDPVQAGADKRCVAEAGVPIALLPAGDYVA